MPGTQIPSILRQQRPVNAGPSARPRTWACELGPKVTHLRFLSVTWGRTLLDQSPKYTLASKSSTAPAPSRHRCNS